MESSLKLGVNLPEIKLERVVVGEAGNTEMVVSAGSRTAKGRIDAAGLDHGSMAEAIAFVLGLEGTKVGQRACQMASHARGRPPGLC